MFGIIIVLILGLLSFMGNKTSWGIFGFLGGLIGAIFTASLGGDGSIIIANAYNTSTSTWVTQSISDYPWILIPLILTIGDFMFVLYKVAT